MVADKLIPRIDENGDKYYVFFDEDFGRLYNAEVRTRKIVSIFSGLAIIIACLGLLALAAFIAEQRTKENQDPNQRSSNICSCFVHHPAPYLSY